MQQFKVQNNAAQCNAERLQCNTCSRLKTSVNSVHLAPRRTLFKEVLKLRVSEVARVPGPAGVCVGCRGISVSSAGKRLLQEENLRKGFVCHLQGITLAGLRTSSTSVPGACRGLQSDVLLS